MTVFNYTGGTFSLDGSESNGLYSSFVGGKLPGQIVVKEVSAYDSITHAAKSTQAALVMKVVKPIRLVYKKFGKRWHLTLGENEGELPMKVTLDAVHLYKVNEPGSWHAMGTPEVQEEIEITLKLRVKSYTMVAVATEETT